METMEARPSAAGAEAAQRELEEAAALFTLLGRLIHGVPDKELMRAACDQRFFDAVPFVEPAQAGQAREEFAAWADACAAPLSDEDLEALLVDYARLFVGTRKVVAPLWESVYFNKDRMVFQHETFQVRSMYARYGLEVDALSHEPDDHLAYELLFVARLCQLGAERAQAGDGEGLADVMRDAASFVACHPLAWVPAWCVTVQEHARTGFYRGYALLVAESLRSLERFAVALARA